MLLEPDRHPAARRYNQALVADGVPAVSFRFDDVAAEVDRPRTRGARVVQELVAAGPSTAAVFDDTCGRLVQLIRP